MENDILILHSMACFILTGLIWTIQLVHYPSFYFYEVKYFLKGHRLHTKQVSKIVLPLMLVELLTGVYLMTTNLFLIYFIPMVVSIFALVIIWSITFFKSIPEHQILAEGKNDESIERLIQTNWGRTLSWTLRSLLLFGVLIQNKSEFIS